MKKLKSVLMSLSLIFCFLFLTACGGDPPSSNQLEFKPTINTSGEYSKILSKEEFDSEITKNPESDTDNKEIDVVYANEVTGIHYYMKATYAGTPMEINTIMKFTANENSINFTQLAMKVNMSLDMGTETFPVEMYAYIKDFNEKKLYMQSKILNENTKQYYTFDNFDDIGNSQVGGANSGFDLFDLTELYEIIETYTSKVIGSVSYTKTEKDNDGVVKYKLSFKALEEDATFEDISNENTDEEMPPLKDMNIYLIVKEIENKSYFQGFSLEAKGEIVDGSVSTEYSFETIVTLFSGNINFPSFKDYKFASHISNNGGYYPQI